MENAVERHVGVVKWFSDAKGFGFVERIDGISVSIQNSQIKMPGYRTLQEGAAVEFVTVQTPKGPAAQSLVVIDK